MFHFVNRKIISVRNKVCVERYLSTQDIIDRDRKYGAHHFQPLPVVLSKGERCHVWDVEGKRYLDFISGFATVNQGHCHPRLKKIMSEQINLITHTSRAFFTESHGELAEYLTNLLGWDRFLPMNTGVEAGDTALKLARRWGYRVKRIPENKAVILFANNNYWGRSLAAVSSSTNESFYKDFGPLIPQFENVPYDDLEALELKFRNDPNICAYMMEPIQGESGVIVPKKGYLKGVRKLCTKYKVLWIADEVQTGLGRTGKRLAVDHENQKPDILILGKALTGGMYPVSGVLANDEIMLLLEAGSHGSTYGGNPLGQKVAIEAVRIIEEEKLAENAENMGRILKKELQKLPKSQVLEFRGRGLLVGLVLNKDFVDGWDFCLKLRDAGLLSRPSYGQIVRIAPPLVINEEELREGINIIMNTLNSYKMS